LPGKTGEAPAIRGQFRIKQLISDEASRVLAKTYKDRELGEVVSLVESVLLDVEQGEIIRSPGYDRDLLAVAVPKPIWRCKP
jgi:hypothetical protein